MPSLPGSNPASYDSFLSSLLPPTTETMQHVLTHGGIGPWAATHHDAVFTALLDETRSLISSSDFARVLEVGLDNAVAVLFDGVEKNVFVDSTVVTGSGLEPWAEPLKLRLAGLLPGLARWSHLALNALPNELVDVRVSISISLPGSRISLCTEMLML